MKIRFIIITLSSLMAANCLDQAIAQNVALENGRLTAQRQCASCHATDETGTSPRPNAPVFRTILSQYRSDVLEQELGRANLDRAIKAYYNQWKFKHPYPEDMKASMEKELGSSLAPYFDLLKKKGGL